MEILINTANILYVTAYFTMNMLRLRLLTVTAACCLAVYFYSQPVPMLNVVAWNLFFILLNLSQIARLLLARYRAAEAEEGPTERGSAARTSVNQAVVRAGWGQSVRPGSPLRLPRGQGSLKACWRLRLRRPAPQQRGSA